MDTLAEILLIVTAAAAVVSSLVLVPTASARRPAIRRSAGSAPPEQLVALERLVVTASSSSLQTHAYLRPVLSEGVERRLAVRGMRLEPLPERERLTLLGDPLGELIRPIGRCPRIAMPAGSRSRSCQ